MPWESEEEGVKPGRDWARIMWAGLAVLIVAGVVTMFIPRGRNTSITEARVRQILIRPDAATEEAARAALDEINGLRERIVNGENFAKLASEYSDDPFSGPRGGDLGWVQREQLNEVVDAYIWTAPIGEVSEVLLTNNGLHLIVVVDRHFSAAEQYDKELKERVLESGTSPEPGTQ